MNRVEREVRRAITTVNSRVREYPLAYLTEADVQAQLYSELLPACGGVALVTTAGARVKRER
jgi:hypothetical protein